jgi:enoyl-CoA hydratase
VKGGNGVAQQQDPDPEWSTYPTPEPLVALAVRRRGAVAEVTLIGPGKGNAMGPDFWSEIPMVFTRLDADDSVRAVVVTGAGQNFSFGLDLAAYGPRWHDILSADPGLAGPRSAFHHEVLTMQRAFDQVAQCRKPVVAAINGWCIGGGVDLISACDVRYADRGAMFSIREVRVAIVADMGSLQRLPAIIGDGHLRELALSGKDITAERAQSIGLVNDVLDDPGGALQTARQFAEEVADNPPLVVQGIKQVLEVERSARVVPGQKLVAAWNAAFLPSEDLVEAMTAFAERRRPKYSGR